MRLLATMACAAALASLPTPKTMAQLIDRTQSPNTANEGIVKSLTDGINFQTGASVSADSRKIVTVEENRIPVIDRMSMQAQNPEPVVSEATGLSAPVWTPDNRIMYEQDLNGIRSLWVVDADGKIRKQISYSLLIIYL